MLLAPLQDGVEVSSYVQGSNVLRVQADPSMLQFQLIWSNSKHRALLEADSRTIKQSSP